MQASGDFQHHSMGTSSSPSMVPRQEFAEPPQQQMGTSASQVRQAAAADDLHSEDMPSQRAEPTGDARLELSQPAEEDVRRGESSESPEAVPQQEISLRELVWAESAREPASNQMGKLDQEPITSRSTGIAHHAGYDAMPSQLSFTPPQEQQQQQPTLQLRQEPSGNPFLAAATAADAPAGDGNLPGRFTGIPTAASTASASSDTPSASPAAPDGARQPLVGDSTIPGKDPGPGILSRSHSGVAAGPQQSGTLRVPEQCQESTGLPMQEDEAAGQAEAGYLGPSPQGSHGNAVSVPCSSMHTATSIAQLLADLPPAGM